MVDPEGPDLGDAGLVFAAHNNHDPSCGRPPRLRNTADPGLYHGYFENRYGEQFVFTFDRTTGTGTVPGGDFGWVSPRRSPSASWTGPAAAPVISPPRSKGMARGHSCQ